MIRHTGCRKELHSFCAGDDAGLTLTRDIEEMVVRRKLLRGKIDLPWFTCRHVDESYTLFYVQYAALLSEGAVQRADKEERKRSREQ